MTSQGDKQKGRLLPGVIKAKSAIRLLRSEPDVEMVQPYKTNASLDFQYHAHRSEVTHARSSQQVGTMLCPVLSFFGHNLMSKLLLLIAETVLRFINWACIYHAPYLREATKG